MKKNLIFALLPVIAILFMAEIVVTLSGCMSMKLDMTDRGPGIVWMKKDCFSPGIITIPVNSSVTWTNKDLWKHTVTSSANIFDSKIIKSGDSFSYKFTTAGTYTYHCEVHDSMMATVIVK